MDRPISQSQSLRFEVDPKPGESLRGCIAIAQSAMSTRRSTFLVLALYVGVGLAAYFLTPATSITTFVIAMVAILATMLVLRFDGQSQMRRLQESDPHALETHFVELDPDGIRTWCAHVEARYPWGEFTKTTENNEFYLFVRRSGTGAAIPKRLLDDETDAALRAHIREWAPDRGAGLAREAT